ncbi:MAG: hypothetical protein M3O28_13210 [Actinomycetota bacterium]|nr:hypothetical protein [Actinomycetota bacterium]
MQPCAVLINQLTESGAGTAGASAAGTANRGSVQLTMQAFVAPSSAAERAQLSAASGK